MFFWNTVLALALFGVSKAENDSHPIDSIAQHHIPPGGFIPSLDSLHPVQTREIHLEPPSYPFWSINTSFTRYKRAPPILPSGWKAGSCIADSGTRILPSYATSSSTNTPLSCANTCAARGFSYAGVEYGIECWCANGFAQAPQAANEAECGMPCAGDASQSCGSGYRMIWFSNAANAPYPASTISTRATSSSAPVPSSAAALPTGWSSVGCLEDRGDTLRLLTGYAVSSLSNTPQACIAACAARGFSIAGVEYTYECYCGNAFNTAGGAVKAVSASECSMPCAGDASQKCGNGFRLSAFRSGSSTPTTISSSPTTSAASTPSSGIANWVPGPCLRDRGSPRLMTVQVGSPTLNTPNWCMNQCATRGYSLAGVEYGMECWCSNSITLVAGESSAGALVAPDSQCNMPCSGDSRFTCGAGYLMKVYGTQARLNELGLGTPTTATTSSSITARGPQTTGSIPGKRAVAHHMIGNTHPYTSGDWARDITLARSAGIDGFALNLGQGGDGSWQRAQVASAYDAAAAAGGQSTFGMFLSLDMTALGCGNQNDANIVRDYIATFGSHPGQLLLPPRGGSALQRVMVSTFAGEHCAFGTGSVAQGWASVLQDQGVVQRLALVGREVAFVPGWFERVETRRAEFGSLVQGDFHWNGAWPAGNYDLNWDSDAYRLSQNPGPLYMAAVSPWFFTHYGADSWNKNWIYRGDNWLYNAGWERVIAHRDQVDIAQVVTWNDYGEASYIGPIAGEQPRSNAWVDGFPHEGWLKMTLYYATAFKTGAYPAITRNEVFIWSRPHKRDGAALADPVGRPRWWDWSEDYLWAVVFANKPASLILTSGSNTGKFQVSPGVNKFKIANAPGAIRAQLVEAFSDAVSIVNVQPSLSEFNWKTDGFVTYNFNAFVAYG